VYDPVPRIPLLLADPVPVIGGHGFDNLQRMCGPFRVVLEISQNFGKILGPCLQLVAIGYRYAHQLCGDGGGQEMLLLNLIEANPKTKFALMHGGYTWVGETGAIAFHEMGQAKNVWIDSCRLPMISYSMAKRALREWLELVPSDRILWGTDVHHAEGIYAAAEFTRRCLGEVLSEKVARGDLSKTHAMQIGTQIMRDNALRVFPRLEALTGADALSDVAFVWVRYL
jgi:hypothetical protein